MFTRPIVTGIAAAGGGFFGADFVWSGANALATAAVGIVAALVFGVLSWWLTGLAVRRGWFAGRG